MPSSLIVAVVFRTDSPCSLCRLHAKASARGPTYDAAAPIASEVCRGWRPRTRRPQLWQRAHFPLTLVPASDLRQLHLGLLQALLALIHLASTVWAGLRQLGVQLLVHALRRLSMRVSTMLCARTSPGRPLARLPLPARERRRLALGCSLCCLRLTFQLADPFLQPRILGFQTGGPHLGGLQGHAVLGDGLRL